MKALRNAKFTLLLSLIISSSNTLGQSNNHDLKDSINVFYDALFEALETHYIHTDQITWDRLKPYYKSKALQSNSFQESLAVCVDLFDTIRGDHTLLFSEGGMYQSTLKKEITQEQLSPSLLNAYATGKSFEVKLIGEHYGYVLIPGMLLLNADKAELDSASQQIYDAIAHLDSIHTIQGWIIDLRLNIGGNANVMIAGLYHLLGNGTTYLDLDRNFHVKMRCGLENGRFYENHNLLTEVEPTLTPKPDIPVVLITGIMTASAGEFVALGFRGRENTCIIGEESYALTTANDLHRLPFGTTVAITESYGTDRSANYTPSIIPDSIIIKESNFEDLLQDKNVIEALKFIDTIND